MAKLDNIIVPEIFSPAIIVLTEQKSRLIASGAVQRSTALDAHLAGGGLTFNEPFYHDLDDDEERVSSKKTDGSDKATDHGLIEMDTEVQVRLSRNKSWTEADLSSTLAGSDPLDKITQRVAYYWTRRLQALFVSVVAGVFASSVANNGDDLTNDVSGTYQEGVTDFSAAAFLDALVTIGDSMDSLGMVMMHSIVYNRAQKNNLIDFVPDARGEVNIPTFLGRTVITDDGVFNDGDGIFHTWIFGSGAFQLGMGSPKVPTEVSREAGNGNGGGQDVLWSRVEWSLHPVGYAYAGATPAGGPSNTTLAAAASWTRVFKERKQIKMARLITREFAATP
ncbi:major capsid protein [Vibrio phage 2.117.O._10N.261.45.E9]|nr:major capsid protein [Vibrio phage 1.117.O._10N.261.45.E9]AUR95432.1 major capsid protein [Vibrio phage 1.207.B._10N.222.51.C2]AUS02323.1 major capsid protein [Vibrio phage 2.117.O._10N.261.45.E9]